MLGGGGVDRELARGALGRAREGAHLDAREIEQIGLAVQDLVVDVAALVAVVVVEVDEERGAAGGAEDVLVLIGGVVGVDHPVTVGVDREIDGVRRGRALAARRLFVAAASGKREER